MPGRFKMKQGHVVVGTLGLVFHGVSKIAWTAAIFEMLQLEKGNPGILVNDLIASKMIVTFMMIAQCWVGFHGFSPPPWNSKFVTENQRS